MTHNKKAEVLLITALAAAEMTCAVESNMIFAAMSTLYRTYGDPALTGWLITAFLLTSAGASAIGGRLGDIYGRNRVLLAMLGIALCGSVLAWRAPDLKWMIAGRALQGVSMSILPLCYGLLKEHLPRDRAAMGIGILASTFAAGAGVGWIGGGLVVDHGYWQDIFAYSSGLALVALVLVARFVPASRKAALQGRLDVVGGLLFVPAVLLVLLGFTFIKSRGWGDTLVWSMITTGLALALIWIWHEARHPEPLINVRLVTHRQIGLANLVFAFLGVGPLLYTTVFFPLLQQPVWTGAGLGLTASIAGLLQVPSIAASIIAGVLSGRITARHGPRRALIIGTAVQASAFFILMLAHSNVWQVVALLVVITGAMNMVFTSVPALVLEAAPEDRSSEATGLIQVVRSIAMAIGAQTVAVLLASHTLTDPAKGVGTFPTELAYTLALGYISLTALVLVPLALAMPRGVRKGLASNPAVAADPSPGA